MLKLKQKKYFLKVFFVFKVVFEVSSLPYQVMYVMIYFSYVVTDSMFLIATEVKIRIFLTCNCVCE